METHRLLVIGSSPTPVIALSSESDVVVVEESPLVLASSRRSRAKSGPKQKRKRKRTLAFEIEADEVSKRNKALGSSHQPKLTAFIGGSGKASAERMSLPAGGGGTDSVVDEETTGSSEDDEVGTSSGPPSPAAFFLTPAQRKAKKLRDQQRALRKAKARYAEDVAHINSAFGATTAIAAVFTQKPQPGSAVPGRVACYSPAELEALPLAPWPAGPANHVRQLEPDASRIAPSPAMAGMPAIPDMVEVPSVAVARAAQARFVSSLSEGATWRGNARVLDLVSDDDDDNGSGEMCVDMAAVIDTLCVEYDVDPREMASYVAMYRGAAEAGAVNAQWVDVYTPAALGAALCADEVAQLVESWLVDWANLKRRQRKQDKSRRTFKRMQLDQLYGMWSPASPDVDELERAMMELTTADVLVLQGALGTGKTQVVYSLAAKLGYRVIEVGPGELRSGHKILSRFGEATRSHSLFGARATPSPTPASTGSSPLAPFFGGAPVAKPVKPAAAPKREPPVKTILLFEEVDVLFDDDRGFWTALDTLVTQSKQPILLTCNAVPPEMDGLRCSYHTLAMEQVRVPSLALHLQLIALMAGVTLLRRDVELLVESCGCDVRACLQQLQFWIQHTACSCGPNAGHVVAVPLWERAAASEVVGAGGATKLETVTASYVEAIAPPDTTTAGALARLAAVGSWADRVPATGMPEPAHADVMLRQAMQCAAAAAAMATWPQALVPPHVMLENAPGVLARRALAECASAQLRRDYYDAAAVSVCGPELLVRGQQVTFDVLSYMVRMCLDEAARQARWTRRRFRHHLRDAIRHGVAVTLGKPRFRGTAPGEEAVVEEGVTGEAKAE
ncbi:uncharacterized protein AMSG_02164 [Thecamonas trahens ATCC 50062]|uniref:AAA+ ATPase domain-containing protein n=1 Tax=Thecamonas trahens ATCC 50062 TaxID=461836 RepID=A0A0L0DX95_THETB|nr:hypothetical protein AMSG_02164 [Thecamonas trahens ATCC 50062]KNC56148.1 hypothetical protein AMSG_02164 [Thecamonas trahens ATCC 50062]|eukprot:XP_013761185.1 hypothetical protein AMSG_02164 [Thecamonas trahens ATCC 50062]